MPTTVPTFVILAIPVRLSLFGVDVQAIMASLRRVSWIDQYQPHPCDQGFVHGKLAQLVESPTVVPSALSFPDLGSIANPSQILKRNGCINALRFIDQLTADCVVNVCLESSFSAGEPFKELFRSPGAFALNRRSDVLKMVSRFANLFARPAQTCTGMGNISLPHINTQYSGCLIGWLSRNLYLYLDVVGTIAALAQYSTGGGLPSQQRQLIVPNRKRNFNPTIQKRHTHNLLNFVVPERPYVQGHRSGPKFVDLLLSCNRTHHTTNSLANMVCLQACFGSDIVVSGMVQLGCVLNLLSLRNLQYLIAPVSKALQGFVNFLTHLYRDLKLAGHRYYLTHGHSITHPSTIWMTAGEAANSSPPQG